MGLLKWTFRILGILVLAIVALGAYLWLTDAAVEATVTDRGSTYAVVTPKVLPTWDYRVELDSTTASVVCVGYQVEFHVQSRDMIIRDADGTLVYSKIDGKETKNTQAAVRCGASNSGGGILG